MLGASSELNLTYGNFYYLDMSINGQDINWTSPAGATVNRIQFQSQNGQISTGMIQVNAVNATIIQNDAVTSAKIGPSAVNSSHLNTTGTYYMGRLEIANISALPLNVSGVLFVNGSTGNVGIGTTSPGAKLSVVGNNPVAAEIYASENRVDNGAWLNLSVYDSSDGNKYTYNQFYYGWNGDPGTDYIPWGRSAYFKIPPNGKSFNFGKSNSTQWMTIKDGNVGINTTSPAAPFHVRSGSNAGAGDRQVAIFEDAADPYITVGPGSNSGGYVIYNQAGSAALGLGIHGAPPVVYIKSGMVGIGTTPSYQLQLSTDSAAKPSTNTWTISSDSRVKKDVRPFTDGLSVVEKIDPVWYHYNGLGGFNADGKDQIGVIGQDIQKAAPYTVNTYKAKLNPDDQNETELLNFNSHALTFVLINSVKELKAENDQLKARLAALEARG